MGRKEIIQQIKKSDKVLEIGPSHNPIAPKKAGYNVEIIDYLDQAGLIEKYKKHLSEINLEAIEEVDYVWSGEKYSDLIKKTKHYDWIIAAHLVEHTPDLIGFLNDCESILKDDGQLVLVVPDKRYCFDYFRPHTGISKIIDAHHYRHTIHTPGTVAEYNLNVVARGGRIAWNSELGGDFSLVHDQDYAIKEMQSVLDKKEFKDVHSWCFVPHSFRLIIQDLHTLGLSQLREVDFYQTEGCEFYISLSRSGKGSGLSRLELLELIDREVKFDAERYSNLKLNGFKQKLVAKLLRA
jgi:predicted SAM-dependent methyltransferase